MAASFPANIKTYTTKVAGDTVQPSHVNDIQDEVTAVETALLTSTSYTPTWGNTGTANTLGNGTIAGTSFKVGTLVHFRIALTWGSTTASGSGAWTFTFPATSDGFSVPGTMKGYAFDNSAAVYYPITSFNNSTSSFQIVFETATTVQLVGATAPMTWATSDSVTIAGWYISAS